MSNPSIRCECGGGGGPEESLSTGNDRTEDGNNGSSGGAPALPEEAEIDGDSPVPGDGFGEESWRMEGPNTKVLVAIPSLSGGLDLRLGSAGSGASAGATGS